MQKTKIKPKRIIHILRVIWLPLLIAGCLETLDYPDGDNTIEESTQRASQTCVTGDSPWLGHGGSFTDGQAQYADITGDGRADLIYQTNDNIFFVSPAKADGSFSTPQLRMQHGGHFLKGQAQYADVGGDGRADLIFRGFDNRFWVSLAVECGFTPPAPWLQHGGPFYIGQAQYPDFNGDGRADVVYQGTDNHYWLSESTGNGFTSPRWIMAHGGGFVDGQTQYADVNGDNKDDLIFQTSDNGFWVSLSNGHSYSSPQRWLKHGGHFARGQAQYPDLNGDGKADLAFQAGDNRFWISLSSGTGFLGPRALGRARWWVHCRPSPVRRRQR